MFTDSRIIEIILDYREIMNNRVYWINNSAYNDILSEEQKNEHLKRIYKTVRHLTKLEDDENYTFRIELINYFYNPERVQQFLLNNPDKHVEDM